MSDRVATSVVVPVYGCRDCLEPLCAQIDAALAAFGSYEIIFVDDRSPDGAWAEIVRLSSLYPALRGIRLSRNFGQQIAISAGLGAAVGARVAVMDCDLQDPPALLAAMMVRMDAGCDIVQARRTPASRAWTRRAMAAAYHRVVSLLSGQRFDARVSAYSLLARKVVDAYLRFGERERHYLYILQWLGFEVAMVDYDHQRRHAGRSSYTLRMLISHAFDGMFFQSTRLLRAIIAMGFGVAGAGLLFAGYFLWRALFRTALPGWTSLAVLILIGTGMILVSLGVIGTYVGKVFAQTKGRPLYVIDEKLGGD